MVLNQKCNPEYDEAVWPTELNHTDFMVIHMLGVHGDFAGQGLAKEMVRFAIWTAKTAGMKAIRLDVLKGMFLRRSCMKAWVLSMWTP